MKLYPIETGNFKLDGGAMFGTIPKSIWQKTNPADGQNKIELAMRALLIEDGDRLILIDCGIGNKQSQKFFGYYDLWGDYDLETSLAQYGFTKEDVTDVFLTHLHFDHCGGAVQMDATHGGYELTFKNAKYWSNSAHWDWATKPNPREKASFLPENFLPIKESGNLNFIDLPSEGNYLHDSPLGFDIIFVDGHTDKQMLPVIRYKGKTIVYVADLVATVGHIPLVYVMGYDTRPLLTMQEKADFLEKAVQEEYLFFFEHDPYRELATVSRTEKGILLDSTFSFTEVFGY
ncbi:MAG: MBL fold metallo-hydrolase [Flavobacteriaceae bacterium]|jgi:glyoxylase-like metal-dependent hydrolase (beta-lactamase superfamily II)|nr:MBL fold metallo-hydrolase [Flavobacteriaceae bacterium]